jgi:hypothetical protein
MRLIDADAICFDEINDGFDRARASIIIAMQPTIDVVTEERCREIAREMIPQFVRQAKAEAYKEVWKELRSMCDAPHWCVWLSEIDDYFEKKTGEVINDDN